jgi:hypothetical protein
MRLCPNLIVLSAAFTVTRLNPRFTHLHLSPSHRHLGLVFLDLMLRTLEGTQAVLLDAKRSRVRRYHTLLFLLNILPNLCPFPKLGPLVMIQRELLMVYLAPYQRRHLRILVHDPRRTVGRAVDMPQPPQCRSPSHASMATQSGTLPPMQSFMEALPLDIPKLLNVTITR